MEKNYLKKLAALVLALCIMIAGLPLNASAAISGDSYVAIISNLVNNSNSFDLQNALLYDLDGNGTQELVLLLMDYSAGSGNFCYSVYTYEKGSAKPVATAVKFDDNASKADGWLGVCRVSGKTYFTVYTQNGIVEGDGATYYSEIWKMYSFSGTKLAPAISVAGRSVTQGGVKRNNHSEKNGKAITLKEYESWKSSIVIMDMIAYYDEFDFYIFFERAREADRRNKTLTGMPSQFTDVSSGAYYSDAVDWAVREEITSGTSSTTFSPDKVCTRAEAVTFLYRAAGKPATPTNTGYPYFDVPMASFYWHSVFWANIAGVTSGVGSKPYGNNVVLLFGPNQTCTRAQIVTFLWRAAGRPEPNSSYNPFYDVPLNSYYGKAVLWAVENNITAGTSTTTFSPDSPCTRGQIVTFLYRAEK